MSAIAINNENYEVEVLKSDKPVLIDFWAAWCGPCQMLGPIVEAIAEENTDIKVCKVNIDENPDLASQFKIMSIPTLVVMKNGESHCICGHPLCCSQLSITNNHTNKYHQGYKQYNHKYCCRAFVIHSAITHKHLSSLISVLDFHICVEIHPNFSLHILSKQAYITKGFAYLHRVMLY